jgi:pimeloyl-ACP methyl ester carboxylesterase
MLPRASFLVRGGYNVLAIDLRGHGESAAQYASPGYLESRDVLGAIQYVHERGEHDPIVLLGLSYGAAAVVLAAAQSEDVAAVIADGVYPSGADVFENINRGIASSSGMNTGKVGQTKMTLKHAYLLGIYSGAFPLGSCPSVLLSRSGCMRNPFRGGVSPLLPTP